MHLTKFTSKVAILKVAIMLGMVIGLFQHTTIAQAAINSYYGDGYFPTNNLNRCHVGGHSTQAQNASATWSSSTDLNMFYNCTGTHITTNNSSWGNTGWAGLAVITNINGQNSLSPGFSYNVTYQSCIARLNQWSFTNNPAFYTNAEIQKLATHELGHCYSLDHATNTSVMNNSSVPQTQDINLINARY